MGFRKVPIKARKSRIVSSLCILACALACLSPARGQTPSEWLTSSGDPARDAWQRSGTTITPANAARITLLWKVKVANKTMGMQSFREPLDRDRGEDVGRLSYTGDPGGGRKRRLRDRRRKWANQLADEAEVGLRKAGGTR